MIHARNPKPRSPSRSSDHEVSKFDPVVSIVKTSVGPCPVANETAMLRGTRVHRDDFDSIVGDHCSMQRLLGQVAQVAPSRSTVLIQGESGTGKELVASAIHRASNFANGPFVRLSCAALAESLLESELFGHERGSFTGAASRRDGKFQQAHGGTLFLDEVGEVPMSLQVKLLRFLQERQFERVGGNETITVDVRVVAATNRELAAAVKQGAFREDLFYRLNVIGLEVPPLRARRSDVPLLAQVFLQRYAKENGRDTMDFSADALRYLSSYPWPGNVRELENAVERAVVMSTGEQVEIQDFPSTSALHDCDDLGHMVPGASMLEVERMVILKTLDAVRGSTSRASDMLGISQRKIQYRLQEWGEEAGAE